MSYRNDEMLPPILITGAARSGTSMVAGIIDRCGAYGGHVVKTPGKSAHHENRAIVNHIIKPWLAKHGFDPMGQEPLPISSVVTADLEFPEQLRKGILRQFLIDGYNGGPWYYKCAKALLIHEAFIKAFPDASWVFVRRPTEQIVDSCMRTGFMRNRTTRAAWWEWVEFHLDKIEQMKAECSNWVEVWSDKIVAGDTIEIKDAICRLGLQWNEEEVSRLVKPELYERLT